jgi:hypothetical protein
VRRIEIRRGIGLFHQVSFLARRVYRRPEKTNQRLRAAAR